MTCKNCGGKFEEKYSYCPYCGCVNERMAGKHYLNEMENIAKDMEELPEETIEIYHSTAKREIKKILKIIFMITGIFLGIFLLVGLLFLDFENDEESMEKQLQWEREYFPVLDKLYEKREYDELLRFLEEHYDDEGQCYYLWENYEYIELYQRYKECIDQKEIIDKKIEDQRYSDTVLIYDASSLIYYRQIYPDKKWEEEQERQLSHWSDEMKEFLGSYVDIQEEQIQMLEEFIESNHYISYDLCREIEKQIKKNSRMK